MPNNPITIPPLFMNSGTSFDSICSENDNNGPCVWLSVTKGFVDIHGRIAKRLWDMRLNRWVVSAFKYRNFESRYNSLISHLF
jgi:hypothetical protein